MQAVTRIIQKALPYLLLFPAVIPLIWWNGLYYPAMVPKTLLLRTDGVLLLAALVYLTLAGTPLYWGRLKARLSWIPGLLLVVMYGTSALGIDFATSFWSSFNRGDGLLTMSVLVVMFYGLLLYADEAFLKRLLRYVSVVGLIAAGVGFLQWLAYLGGITLPFFPSQDRVGGTIGNAAFFAGYLTMTTFVTLALLSGALRKSGRRLIVASALFQGLVAVLTATRGSILALLGVGFLGLSYAVWRERGRRRTTAGVVLSALVLLGAGTLVFRGSLAQSSFEPLRRVASISVEDATVSSRLFIWKSVGAESLHHALTGVGAEHISSLFDRIYDPTQIDEQWFDRTHNSFLDYFVQYGVLGLLLYGALILAMLWSAYRLRSGSPALSLALAGMTLAYAVQDFFVFDTATTLWLLLFVYAVLRVYGDLGVTKATKLRIAVIPAPVIGLLFVLLLVPIWYVGIQPLRADAFLADAYTYHVADVERETRDLSAGMALRTYAALEYGYVAYQMYEEEQLTRLQGAPLAGAYAATYRALQYTYEHYPYDARTALYFAHLLATAPPGTEVDQSLLQGAIERTIQLSPKRSQPYYILANISLGRAEALPTGPAKAAAYQEAIGGLLAYVGVVPNLPETDYVLANLYLALGDRTAAAGWATRGYTAYHYDAGTDSARRAAGYYINTGDFQKAERFLEDAIKKNPNDLNSQYDLAKAAFLAGDQVRALQVYGELVHSAPALVASDPAFVAAIQAYRAQHP